MFYVQLVQPKKRNLNQLSGLTKTEAKCRRVFLRCEIKSRPSLSPLVITDVQPLLREFVLSDQSISLDVDGSETLLLSSCTSILFVYTYIQINCQLRRTLANIHTGKQTQMANIENKSIGNMAIFCLLSFICCYIIWHTHVHTTTWQ